MARGTDFDPRKAAPLPTGYLTTYLTTYLLGSGRSRTGPLNRARANNPHFQRLYGGSAGSKRIYGR